MKPSISVIIPTYNRRKFITRAISSVLVQTRPPDEIIVVDDGSTDDTKQILPLNVPSVRYVYQENGGQSSARNTGLRLAQGNVVAFLDSDDFWPKERLGLQSALMDRHPEADIISGRIQWIRSSRTSGDFENIGEAVHTFPSMSPSLFKKSGFDRIGLFDTSLRQGEDMDWSLRALECGLMRILHDEVMTYHLRHDANITQDAEASNQSMLRAIRLSMERRRRHGGQGFMPLLPTWAFPLEKLK